MDQIEAKPEFLFIFRDTDLDLRFPETAVNQAMYRLNDWIQRWSSQGVIKGGQPLAREGKIYSKADPKTMTDGPFAETKEVVGGYIVVHAETLDEAARVAGEWPLLDYGASVEVRPLLPFCPLMARAGFKAC